MAGFWYLIADTLTAAATMGRRRGQIPQRAAVGVCLCSAGVVLVAPSALKLAVGIGGWGWAVALVIGVLTFVWGVAVLVRAEP